MTVVEKVLTAKKMGPDTYVFVDNYVDFVDF